jgi:Proprotein convertase P-domain
LFDEGSGFGLVGGDKFCIVPTMLKSLALLGVAIPFACGPAARQSPSGDDDDDGGGDGGTNMQGSNNGSNCVVDQPQSTPLALPDTNQSDGSQPTCTTNADCSGSTPNCVITGDTTDTGGPGFCSASYVDTLDFVGFGSGATLTDTTKLISVCATLEHSWVGDLQIDLISPDGKMVSLRQFIGRKVDSIFLGHPDYCDSDDMPIPGSGYKYCWTASAATKLIKGSGNNYTCGVACESWDGLPTNSACGTDGDGDASPPYSVIPAGNYLPDVAFSALQGAQLNGKWSFRVTDLWEVDNGYLFDWSIQFDSSLVANCSNLIQ